MLHFTSNKIWFLKIFAASNLFNKRVHPSSFAISSSSSFYQNQPSSFNFLAGFTDLSKPSVITRDDYDGFDSVNTNAQKQKITEAEDSRYLLENVY